MNREKKKILSVFLSVIIVLILYIFLHEMGHCIVAVACGATITEFSILTAHMSYVGGSYTDISDLWLHANGVAFPLVVSYVYMMFYNREKKSLVYRVFSCFVVLMPMFSLLAWVVIPIVYLGGNAPANDDVTKFLDNFSVKYSPICVTLGAAVLITLSITGMFRKRIIHNFRLEIRGELFGKREKEELSKKEWKGWSIQMKNKLLGVLLVLALVGVVIGVLLSGGENVTTFWFTEEIIVENGVADEEETTIPFTLQDDGKYVIYTDWEPEKEGLISGLALRDAAGGIKFFVTGEAVQAESLELELEAGEYKAQYIFFTNDVDLERMAKETDAVTYKDSEYTYAENETYEITYHFRIERTDGVNLFVLGCVLICGLAGALLVVLILKLARTDGRLKAKYDERQLLARGKGFKYGFFTQMIYNAVIAMFYMLGVRIPAEEEVVLFFGVLLGLSVYVIYCIIKEAYVSLNEKASRLTVIFSILGVGNFIIGVMNCSSGRMIVDGMLTFRCINLMCGIDLVAIAVALAISAAKSKQEED